MTSRVRLAFSAIVIGMLFPLRLTGEVYLNRQWDDASQSFKVQPLVLAGTGVTLDRQYQNAYGTLYQLPPGPPFIIEAAVYVSSIRDGNGDITSKAWLKFRNDEVSFEKPFEVTFMGDPYDAFQEIAVEIEGDFGAEAVSSLDPIVVQGRYRIRSRGDEIGFTGLDNSYELRWKYCRFTRASSATAPFEFEGGHVSFESSTFQQFNGGFTSLITASFADYAFQPRWSFVLRDCAFASDSSGGPSFISIASCDSVVLADNHFDNVTVFRGGNPSLIDVSNSILHRVTGNHAEHSTVRALRVTGCTSGPAATIQAPIDCPVLATMIYVPREHGLLVDNESVLKFYPSQGGIRAVGTLSIVGSVLTSSEDDSIGGDSDCKPQPAQPSAWYHSTTTSVAGGISCDSGGTLSINGGRIRYAVIGVRSSGTTTILRSTIERGTSVGIHLVGEGATTFRVEQTSVSMIRSGGWSGEAAIRIDDVPGNRSQMVFEQVRVQQNDLAGIAMVNSSNSLPFSITLNDCRILANKSHGLSLLLLNPSAQVRVNRTRIAGNGDIGIATSGSAPGAQLMIANSVIEGNGYGAGAANRNGIVISGGILEMTGCTLLRNKNHGMNITGLSSSSQSRIANCLFAYNGNRGVVQTATALPLLTSSRLWMNAGGELIFSTGSQTLTTAAELQALGGEYATVVAQNPGYRPHPSGSVSTVAYDSVARTTTFTLSGAGSSPDTLAGTMLCPDTTQPAWFVLQSHQGDSVAVLGDASAGVQPGDPFRISDFHLADTSLSIEAGNNLYAYGTRDIDGDPRLADGDFNDTATVDIGADEVQGIATLPFIVIKEPHWGQLFITGDTIRVTWTADGIDSLEVLATSWDDTLRGTTWVRFPSHVAAEDGQLSFRAPAWSSGRCRVMLRDIRDSSTYAVSNRFRVRGPFLSRFAADSSYERFHPVYHGWSFANDSAHMWPSTHWEGFNYATGIDPHTGFVYPSFFQSVLHAIPSDFPDWGLFVDAFTVAQCYESTPGGLYYRPSALLKWGSIKKGWRGSCSGFALSALWAFDDAVLFQQAFPLVGPAEYIGESPFSTAVRSLINRLALFVHGRPFLDHYRLHFSDGPGRTLALTKALMRTDYRDDAYLYISGLTSAHAVVPIALLPDTSGAPQKFQVRVYDMNYPSDDTRTILVDTTTRVVQYESSIIRRCFLMNPVSEYHQAPELARTQAFELASPLSPPADRILLAVNGSSVFSVTDSLDRTTGHDPDTLFNAIPEALPLIIPEEESASTISYLLPAGSYSMRWAKERGRNVMVSAFSESVILGVERRDSDSGAAAAALRGASIVVSHKNTGSGVYTIWGAALAGNDETLIHIANVKLSDGDSVGLADVSPAGTRFINRGGQTSYRLELYRVTPAGGGRFAVDSILIGTRSTHLFSPPWSTGGDSTVTIYVDAGNDGTIDSSFTLRNAILLGLLEREGLSLPARVILYPNYPNPFNPNTTIRYGLPNASHVTLTVYNTVGQEVAVLVDGPQDAGYHEVRFRASGLASGVYFYRLRAGDSVESRKLLLLR